MLKKTRINIAVATTVICSGLLATTFIPNLNLSAPTEQDSFSASTDTNAITPRIAISEIEDISTTNLTRSNMTWPNDVYSTVGGYNFLTFPDKQTVYSIDAKGLTLNTLYPSYSSDYEPLYFDGGGTQYKFYYPTLSTNLLVDGSTYDVSKNTLSGNKRISSMSMTFGNTSNDNFKGKSSVSLSRTQPFLKIQTPLANFSLERWNTRGGESECSRSWTDEDYPLKNYFKSIKNPTDYNGELQPSVSSLSTHLDSWGKETTNSSSQHYHTNIVTQTANISIYNDYNTSGVLLGTYLLNTASGFNTVLPKLTVAENLLDKTENVLEQDLTQSNLFKIADGQSIPSMGGYSLTAEKTPTTETIVFTYKPKFVFTNGLLVEYNGPGVSTTVTGFSKLRTFITPLDDYNHNIVIDRFIKYVTKDGVIAEDVLGTFLDLSSVPPDVTYEITNSVADLISGILKFKITASNGYSEADVLLNKPTPKYTMSIQLTPRITKIGYTGFLDNILVSEYYSKVFNSDGSIKLAEFNKYASIIAPVDDAQYYLVPDSYTISEADGNVDFKLYAITYYGADAQEKSGALSDTSTHFDVNLVVNPLRSNVAVKKDYVLAHRVDKFIGLVTNADGSVKDLDLLKQYVDMEYIPTTAIYAIDLDSVVYDSFNADFYYEYVNFDLVISKYNETSFDIVNNKIIPLRVKLNAVHLKTEVLPKTVTNPERVDRLLPRIINEQGLVTDSALLEQYVDIKALPKRSILSIDNIQVNNQSGKLSFNLNATVAYDNDSNELLDAIYPVELQLGVKHTPTTVTPVANITNPERVDRFAQQLTTLDSDGIKNYLVPKYLSIDGEFPVAENTLAYSVSNLTYQDVGTVHFNLVISDAYDTNSDPQSNYSFPISLSLAQKFAPTNISVYAHYPQGSTVDEFRQLYAKYKDNQVDLKKFLSHFLKGVDTIPDNAITTIEVDDDQTDSVIGKVVFNVQTTTYYDANSDLINNPAQPYISADLQLNLVPQDQQASLTTTVDWKNDISIGGKAVDFYAVVNPNNKVDFEELSNYLDLENIPLDAEISIENKDPQFKSPLFLSFDVVLTQWWETGSLKPQSGDAVQVKRIPLQKNLYVINTNTKSLSFQWWWIALGVAGLVLLVTSHFLAKQYKEDKSFKQRALEE